MFDSELFEPFDKLVEIVILGETKNVPENNNLLRCFQFLSLETVTYGEFCWNRDCANCQIWLENTRREEPKLACRTIVRERMKIARLSEQNKLEK